MSVPMPKHRPDNHNETGSLDDTEKIIADLDESTRAALEKIEFHESEAEKLKDALYSRGFDYETHRQNEDEEDEKSDAPKRSRNQGKRRRIPGGQGRVTSSEDGRLKGNESDALYQSRHQTQDGRGRVTSSEDRRLKENRD